MHFLPADTKENAHMHKVLLPLRIFGAVIYSDQRYKRVIFGIYIFCSINFMPILAMQIYALNLGNLSNIGNASMTVATAMHYLNANFQIIMLLFRRKEFIDIITYIARDAKRLYLSSEETEQKIYKTFISITRNIFLVIYLPVFVAIFIVLFTSAKTLQINSQVLEVENILEVENVPFLFLIYPFRNLTKNYFIAYIYPYFAFFTGILFISGWHVTMSVLLLYPNFIFKLIKLKLGKLDKIVESKLNEELVSLIELQGQTTKLVKRLESFISAIVFVDFILFSVLICFLLYQFSENSNTETFDLYILITYFFVTSLMYLLYHAIGNEIYYEVDTLSTAFYMSSWYSYPLSVRKTGLMIMIGSAQPIQMKAGYIDMRLSTFLSIMRASYGLFTMLRNINHREK